MNLSSVISAKNTAWDSVYAAVIVTVITVCVKNVEQHKWLQIFRLSHSIWAISSPVNCCHLNPALAIFVFAQNES